MSFSMNYLSQGIDPVLNRLQVQHGCVSPLRVMRSQQVTVDLIRRLGLETELEGHTGCVNCLEWNESGTRLASGSDDCNLILWDPFEHKKLSSMKTQHTGNIFSVKFLPNLNDSLLVTGAADCRIKVHDLERMEVRHSFSCHMIRVKRLATAPSLPYLFWSASEDGTVRQFDLRDPDNANSTNPANVLVNLNNHVGSHGEAKCLAINPMRPDLLAIGSNDPYVRLFDRRMLSLRRINDQSKPETECDMYSCANESSQRSGLDNDGVQYYVPGHIPRKSGDYRRRYRSINITYLSFSPNGQDMVVNMGGEQVYLFSLFSPRPAFQFDMSTELIMEGMSCGDDSPDDTMFQTTTNHGRNGISHPPGGSPGPLSSTRKRIKRSRFNTGHTLPPGIEALKRIANGHFEEQRYSSAISLYNEAIRKAPDLAVLYGNRAAAYLKRNWDGDVYAALLDCHSAISLDSGHLKAHFRLIRCLRDLNLVQEAQQCLTLFKQRFPDHASGSSCVGLETAITERLNEIRSKEAADSNRRKSDLDTTVDSNSSSCESGAGDASENLSNHSFNSENNSDNMKHKSRSAQLEEKRSSSAFDYTQRYCGHCNTTTDIKEANFFGSDGQFIMAGSDDGSFFIWDRYTANIVRVLRGDDSIVNCLQPHPSTCLLASSGIDHVVRLWSPRPEQDYTEDREIADREEAASANQRRMNADPLEVMLMNMGYRFAARPAGSTARDRPQPVFSFESGAGGEGGGGGGSSGEESQDYDAVPCRTS